MFVLGFLLLVLGIASTIYGDFLNDNIELQLKNVLFEGNSDPGNQWIYLGIAFAIIGAILLTIELLRHNKGKL